jgi:hypothetical protein
MKKKISTIRPLIEKLLYLGVIGISIFLLFFVITCTWIGYEVKDQCFEAQKQYSGDCTDALVFLLNDDNRSYRDRNSAIWALGQLGQEKALPVLNKYYTGVIPKREPLDKVISQYELKKAINLAKGGFNITSVFWKTNL